jgi:hypothetical protein
MKDKIRRFITLRTEKAELEGLLKAVNDELNEISVEMINEMDSSGISQLTAENGEKLSLVKTRYTQVNDFMAFQNWCEQNGSQELLKLTFDRRLVNELCFGLNDTNQTLPDGVEVGVNQSLRVYKGNSSNWRKTLVEVLDE